MYKYEYNVTLENRDGIWYYVVAQEFNESVEFLGWGITDTAAEAVDCINQHISSQFLEV